MKQVLSRSMAEEIISALWLIAALFACLCGFRWLAIALFIKSGLDTLCAIYYALAEVRQELANRKAQNQSQPQG